jgi:hypothetical protein
LLEVFSEEKELVLDARRFYWELSGLRCNFEHEVGALASRVYDIRWLGASAGDVRINYCRNLRVRQIDWLM